LKFSGSPKAEGHKVEIKKIIAIVKIMGLKSFHENSGWNFIISFFFEFPLG